MDYSGEIVVPKAIEKREKELGRKLNSSFEITDCINSLCRAYNINECIELIKGTAIIVLSNTPNPHHDILNEIMQCIDIGDKT